MKYKKRRQRSLLTVLLIALAFFFAGAFPQSIQAKTYRNISAIVPKVSKQVREQIKKHHCKIITTRNLPSGYAGWTESRIRYYRGKNHLRLKISILPQYLHSNVPYHEVGHCVDYLCSSTYISNGRLYVKLKSSGPTFRRIYRKEVGKYRALDWETNEDYVTANTTEFFAQAYAEYTCHPKAFRKMCPKTYAFIKSCNKRVKRGKVMGR